MTIRSFKTSFPKIDARAYVDDSAAVIGDVHVGEDASIWPMCSIRGDVNRICIGARSNIQDGSVIHVTHRYSGLPEGHATLIGNDVTVGHKVILHGCTVEDLCLIGMGSVVLDGAVIRSKVLLGAGSLVPEGRELEGGFLWLGRPAKKVRELTDDELRWFAYSAGHYVKLKDDYME
ncbi:MAG: gamma carbonic anhydrase family protein [Gallionellales bacterium 35-53-114]|jgi:carbonic anhydrase/acetyltransferase-like protein (isoleucine patch superfamily)|nr:MAG: gamma carbonic anhydrase family protein [Gallionellales bacterium 35-53-114]OYZ65178.1 MAG: gamma carbonic anhydrase family protein [Gallionellales bacterium 24-53-125]OZB08085.1 MAG: gamma carbonic anhydrase family protein [Gallionellales bacterium 39-52-133]HQS58003.1 gamma carbonic anhydrase family protein [Gallionellaceae bacterium]HQS73559.1 gamma carbonic anhydrase family protein [Gallionellaceae bacterium]